LTLPEAGLYTRLNDNALAFFRAGVTVDSTAALEEFGFYVGGEPGTPRRGEHFESVDPATGRPWALIADADVEDVDECVRNAREAFLGPWAAVAPSDRGLLLFRLADAIDADAERLAALETRENGKLHREMVAQMKLVPKWLRYFAGMADKIEGRTIPLDRQSIVNYTVREPLGVVGVIMPWNSPMFLSAMAVGPALAAGNTVVVKPSEVTSTSVLEVARLATEVGFPPGALNIVTGLRQSGEALVRHPDVAKISLTGGIDTGRAVGLAAMERLAKVTLELGGKSANIVFEDADVEAAEAGLLAGIFAAAGQTCVAGSRAFIHESLYDELVERIAARAARIRIGHPMEPDTEMGPIATRAQFDKIASFVERGRSEGGEIITGGRPAEVEGLPDGYFYEPTVVAGADAASHLAQNEVFGPVLAVFPFTDEEEVVRLANDSRYGLAAGLWTRDVRRAHRMARNLEAGTVWINMYRAMAPQSPFGGYKESGIGRQNGSEAILEYVQTKSVWVELSDEVQDPFILRV
jgi:acyl-CoA reductase-like NAD-dependent aldehyde dehydrogenase